MNPISLIVADESSTFTATVVIAGIAIVVGMLVLLIFIFKIFGNIVSNAEKSAKKRKMKKEEKRQQNLAKNSQINTESEVAPVVTQTAPLPVASNGISDEVVAVITAAVVASEGTSVVIRQIKKSNVTGRNPWASAAIYDNTRPF